MPYFDANPYFVGYQPYPFPSGSIPVDSVIDMISYSPIPPSSSVFIDYNVGASGSYSFTYNIKNITTNTQISASITTGRHFTATVLTPISSMSQQPNTTSTASVGFILNPQQTGSILIELNKTNLTIDAGEQNITASVKLNVTNLPNQAALRNLTTSLITASRFSTSSIEVS